jgi:hypothetical protein
LTTWLAAVREEVSPKSYERYAEIARHFLMAALGNLPLAKLALGSTQDRTRAAGHASITTTLDLYSHVTDTMQSDAAARLDAAFALAQAGPDAGK